MNEYLKRTWVNIKLDNLHYNIKSIKSKLFLGTKIMAVVKADAYGHGDKLIARALVDEGIDFFAVSNLDEALSLRSAGIKQSILILGYTPVESGAVLAQQGISQTVFSLRYASELSSFCTKQGCCVSVHIKLDTGMSRLGIVHSRLHSSVEDIKQIKQLAGLDAVGIFSHFSSADALDSDSAEYTKMQMAEFDDAVDQLKNAGISFQYKHLQNSAGISFASNAAHPYSYARAGIVMYGIAPSDEKPLLDLRPVMELKSVISMIKEVEAGTAISYGRNYVADKKTTVATVPIGYADGYSRLLSNRGEMLVNGKRARIIGNICMDQLMLDVTDIDGVREGDIVTVIGRDGDEEITFSELADIVGTISYELMCIIGRRVPRVYIKGGKTIDVVDYLIQ